MPVDGMIRTLRIFILVRDPDDKVGFRTRKEIGVSRESRGVLV